jgi:hypothetical protein
LFPNDLYAVATAFDMAAKATADDLRTTPTLRSVELSQKLRLTWVAGAGFEPA